ncbi:MAG: manganese efflux pump [Ruminococcaceae bacterium]|nr:manganese efflux pump [Oscillospiraceae bacterium]
MGFTFFFNSIALGAGLAMDAFSVSLANGMNEPKITVKKVITIAGIFAFFQALMPILGYVCVHTIVNIFSSFQKLIPWIALILLSYIGGKMLIEGIKNKCDEDKGEGRTTFTALLVQGVATSIDALSTGFTISEYSALEAVICAAIIALVTFIICFAGVFAGKKFGTCMAGKASIFGGIILIIIGIEIFITGIF